jgi:hypothetical protein
MSGGLCCARSRVVEVERVIHVQVLHWREALEPLIGWLIPQVIQVMRLRGCHVRNLLGSGGDDDTTVADLPRFPLQVPPGNL